MTRRTRSCATKARVSTPRKWENMRKKSPNSDVIASVLGPKLRAARLARGLKQQEVATLLSCNPEYYGRLERGKGLPSVEMLDHLLGVLGLDADELLHEAIAASPPLKQIDTLPQEQRQLADAIIAQGIEFVRLAVRILDYCANREEHERQAAARDDDPPDDAGASTSDNPRDDGDGE